MKRLDAYLKNVPNELEAPAGSLTEQALWYQRKLESLAPDYHEVSAVYRELKNAWATLHRFKFSVERKLIEIKELEPILEPKEQKKRGSRKGKALDASLKSKLKGLDISEEDKVKLARTLGIEI